LEAEIKNIKEAMFSTAGFRNFVKALLYGIALAASIVLTEYLVENYVKAIIEYKAYLIAIEVLAFGYLIVENLAWGMYKRFKVAVGRGVAAVIRIVTRISGYAVIIASLTSVFNTNPSAALTVGSFAGLVVGFAFQAVLGNAIAGIFLAVSRPFAIGDRIAVKGIKGVVQDIGIMHTIIDTGEDIVLVPSSIIVKEIITKKKRIKEEPKEANE